MNIPLAFTVCVSSDRQGEQVAMQEHESETQSCNAPAVLKQLVMPLALALLNVVGKLEVSGPGEGLHRAPEPPMEVSALRQDRGGSCCIQGTGIETKL